MLAVTPTPATFFDCRLMPVGSVTPNCCSMLIVLCVVNGVWSPVPSSPTTRP